MASVPGSQVDLKVTQSVLVWRSEVVRWGYKEVGGLGSLEKKNLKIAEKCNRWKAETDSLQPTVWSADDHPSRQADCSKCIGLLGIEWSRRRPRCNLTFQFWVDY